MEYGVTYGPHDVERLLVTELPLTRGAGRVARCAGIVGLVVPPPARMQPGEDA
jgi:hypothetical protein